MSQLSVLRMWMSEYFKLYGGWRTLFRSPYLWLSFAISVLSLPLIVFGTWYDLPMSTNPSLIGFSLAGYICILTLGGLDFTTALCEEGEQDEFLSLSATFTHYNLLLIVSLLLAILAKATYVNADLVQKSTWLTSLYSGNIGMVLSACTIVLHTLCYWGYIYALVLIVPTIGSVFRMSGVFRTFILWRMRQRPPQKPQSPPK